MGSYIIGAVIIIVCAYAVYGYVRKLRRGGSCCSEGEAAEKKVKVTDRDKTHYPYACTLTIDGMTCSNCARRVENALNRVDGVWATVDLMGRRADLRLKEKPDEEALRRAVRDAGYTVLSVQEGSN